MEPKKTSYKNLLANTIAKFLCYFILIGFIYTLIVFIIQIKISHISNLGLTVCLSLISAILTFFILHFICQSTTIETFRHTKLDLENSKKFLNKMNLFFMLCIIISIIACIGYLFFDNFIFTNAIQNTYQQYNYISPEFANKMVDNIIREYDQTFLPKLFSTIICELALVSSFISLIPYQEKLVKKYNV